MKILALNGFMTRMSSDWPIGEAYPEPVCPYVPNWNNYFPRDQLLQLGGIIERMADDILLCGFSDGGTFAHIAAQKFPQVKALAVHSGLFTPRLKLTRKFPIRLYLTTGDRFHKVRYWTKAAMERYEEAGFDVKLFEFAPTLKPSDNKMLFKMKHEFRNAVPNILEWYKELSQQQEQGDGTQSQ